VYGLGCRVKGLGLGVEAPTFQIQLCALGFQIKILHYKIWALKLWV
jgi:hypothetical protein